MTGFPSSLRLGRERQQEFFFWPWLLFTPIPPRPPPSAPSLTFDLRPGPPSAASLPGAGISASLSRLSARPLPP